MKTFFFLLLFINISVFLWEHNMTPPEKEDSRKVGNRIDPSVEKIVLVSEAQRLQTTSDDKENNQVENRSMPVEDLPKGISDDLRANEGPADEKTATEIVNGLEFTEPSTSIQHDSETNGSISVERFADPKNSVEAQQLRDDQPIPTNRISAD